MILVDKIYVTGLILVGILMYAAHLVEGFFDGRWVEKIIYALEATAAVLFLASLALGVSRLLFWIWS